MSAEPTERDVEAASETAIQARIAQARREGAAEVIVKVKVVLNTWEPRGYLADAPPVLRDLRAALRGDAR